MTMFWKYVCDVFALGHNAISLYINKTVADLEGPNRPKLPHPLPDLTPPVGYFWALDIARHFHVSFVGISS